LISSASGNHNADDNVERALGRPLGTCEDRRAQLEQRHPVSRHVLATLDEQLRCSRRYANLYPVPVRAFRDLQQTLLVVAGVGDDQLVELVTLQCGFDAGIRLDFVDEVVVDAAAARAEHLAQVQPLIRIAYEHHPAPNAHRAHHRTGEALVARAEQADQQCDEQRADDIQAERLEVLAGADRERERECCDEHDARHDAPRPFT
jgi:hypothetical protein